MESEHYDSDKENRDPALTPQIIPRPKKSPASRKRRNSHNKHRETVVQLSERLVTSEETFVFGKLRGFPWWPGKIIQSSNPNSSENITCYWFGDNNISELSKDKLSSFFNYGSKVDFKKLKSNQRYKNSILMALRDFAEIHRPDLLTHEDNGDKDSLLLDWARLGFVGCPGLNKRKAERVHDYENKDSSVASTTDDEVDISLPVAKRKELSELTTIPLSLDDPNSEEPCSSLDLLDEETTNCFTVQERTNSFEKERTPSCDTIDSGYNSTSPSCSPSLTQDDPPLCGEDDALSTSSLNKSPVVLLSSSSTKSPRSPGVFTVNPDEFDKLVFGKLKKYGWWPGRICDPATYNKTVKYNQRLVYWFGDCLHSKVSVKDLAPINRFYELYQPLRKLALYRVSLYDFLSEAAAQCSFNQFPIPDEVTVDEEALVKLIEWAQNQFPPMGCPPVWCTLPEPNTSQISELSTEETLLKSPSKRRKIEPKTPTNIPSTTPAPTAPSIPISATKRSAVKKCSGTCLACSTREATKQHPLFEGVICDLCFEQFVECAFVFGDDGTQDFCSICCQSGNLFVCDENQCGRAYCYECIDRLCGKSGLKHIENSDPWFCFLCSSDNLCDKLIRRDDWQEQLRVILTNDHGGQYKVQAPPPSIPMKQRTAIRVLSLFDGIATGLVALKNIGFELNHYISSEIDEDSVRVVKIHHPEVVHLGDIRDITQQQIEEMGPFDIVMGGSPCNDLSMVNPARKGIYEGTGKLFFEYFRILTYAQKSAEKAGKHVFWLFENVVSMRAWDKATISRFLQNHPIVINARDVSCMNRARFFWGNLPGMSRTMIPTESDRLTLQECLEKNCGRKARFEKIKCITTKSNSIKQKNESILPVRVEGEDGAGDWLWCTEMERVFGLAPHYTDVANMSRVHRQRLLGKAWSIPVLRHLFLPLREYFKCSSRE